MSNNNFELQTPVLFLVFNRLDTTKQVFEAIRQAQPPRLYVAADGPRSDRLGEAEKVKLVRDYVMDHVDWECEVKTLFREQNLGCRVAVSSAIDWFFENEEMGIILEDDCLPDPTFFAFCEQLLYYYRDDKRIMVVSGDNFQFGRNRTEYSYYFSRYNHCWGWATWRRAWKYFDFGMRLWVIIRDGDWLKNIFQSPSTRKYWTKIFQSCYDNKVNSWAYRWAFACWIQNGLTIIPNVNLVSNIGFGEDATHTRSNKSPLVNIPLKEMVFPLKHPPFIIRNKQADDFADKHIYKIFVSYFKSVLGIIFHPLVRKDL